MASANDEDKQSEVTSGTFKKPILIGKIGKFPRKMQNTEKMELSPTQTEEVSEDPVKSDADSNPESTPPSMVYPKKKKEESIGLSYKEPPWGGFPESSGKNYSFEVLKNGSIIETINLMSKSYWVFGRLPSCDIVMQHPTVSRYHAVLQYRRDSTDDEPGFYIYDLGSTHGTFLNKNRMKPRTYGKVHVGHMLNFGCSSRTFLLNGPDNDEETESPFTVTELKQQRAEKIQKLKEEEKRRQILEEERGVDWGLGEDADEETDLSENPYAETNNEEFYIDNPKKALRGFFEREGLELEYDCTEQGYSQFLCKVELPIDDEKGRPIYAEVYHKGKKKEAVLQCALEACRILDRHGLLRQAVHESRKRKPKNWEENDYYDSDEDTFLDRTGTIEKKREFRMKGKAPQKVETYESLMEQEKKLSESMKNLEREISSSHAKTSSQAKEDVEEDSLDSYMKELKENKPKKVSVMKLKAELAKLKKEHESVVRLINITRPASLPPLVLDNSTNPTTSSSELNKESNKSKGFPVFGKPKKLKVQLPEKSKLLETSNDYNDEEEEDEKEEEQGEEEENKNNGDNQQRPQRKEPETMETEESSETERREKPEDLDKDSVKELPMPATKFQEKLSKIVSTLKKLALNGDRMDVEWKTLGAKKRKVLKLISNLNDTDREIDNEKLQYQIALEINRIINELNKMTKQKYKVLSKVTEIEIELTQISDALMSTLKRIKEDEKDDKQTFRKSEKRQKKSSTFTNTSSDNYDMWVPPNDQTGDGRTTLNDKFGY